MIDNTINSSGYHDLSELHQLHQTSKTDANDLENLKKVSSQFEAIFVQMLLKSMRDANSAMGKGLLNSKEMDLYQSMFDQQISLSMAESKGIGLAEVMVRQLATKNPG